MIFEGTYEIKAPTDKVWDYVSNPRRIANCLPDLKSLDEEGPDRFVAVVRIGVGFIKGDFRFRFSILDKKPPSHARLKATGTGSGSTVDVDTLIDLREVPAGTRLAYKADVKVSGPIAGFGQRIMEPTVKKNVDQMFDRVKKEFER